MSLLDKSKRLQHLTTQQQQSESDALYFLFNFAPLYIITDGQVEQRIIARYNDYNPEIYQLINGFFTRFPYNFKLDIHLPDDICQYAKRDRQRVSVQQRLHDQLVGGV